MLIFSLKSRSAGLLRLGVQIAQLPVARLHFHSRPHPDHIAGAYRHFVKPHPKYKIFRNKSLGAALIDLRSFASGDAFVESLRSHGRAVEERRRAIRRGYVLRRIDRNDHVDEIHGINISSSERQGRAMDSAYLTKQIRFDNLEHFEYFGLFDQNDELRAYCNLCHLANFAFIDRVIGYKNPDGAMYLLITEIACNLIAERKLKFLMYDTMFGAQPGLLAFKQKLGFRPYRAKYACVS
jgi:hypothetical protein